MSDLEKLTAILVETCGTDPAAVRPEAILREDLGADSLDLIEIIMAIEEEWAIDIPDDVAEKLTTVKDVLDHIESPTA